MVRAGTKKEVLGKKFTNIGKKMPNCEDFLHN
jgi:hypothetical protein